MGNDDVIVNRPGDFAKPVLENIASANFYAYYILCSACEKECGAYFCKEEMPEFMRHRFLCDDCLSK